ncbi:hypothetical protein [Enterobacter soli]|uniref:hypothetical protein n=1 Tax=Enterobacter soli TaxID=885040 RepID=UPI0034CD3ED0
MTRKKTGLIIAFNLILAAAALLWYSYTPPLSLVCQGNLSFANQRGASAFHFEGGVTMRFHPDGSGYFTLNGDVSRDAQQWQVSRQETFRWKHMHDSLYEITIEKIDRYAHDEVPAGVLEEYVTGITLGKTRLLTLERTPEDAVVIGNFYAPLLFCAD